MKFMHQILYVSVETHQLTKNDLKELLAQSRAKNKTLGITGILIHYKKHFFQILEGEQEKVFELFRTIKADNRHMSVILVWDEPIEERSFKEWSMAFLDLGNVQKAELANYSEFLKKGFTTEITKEHLTFAQKLLIKFTHLLE